MSQTQQKTLLARAGRRKGDSTTPESDAPKTPPGMVAG